MRIMRTCQEMDIRTVAVYSEADEQAPHTKMADEAYYIGPSHVSESYLRIESILDVAKQANVDAIHPGYGLLSENSTFAQQCMDEGYQFIGPNPIAIEKMGDKIAARNIMKEAKVPVIPGTEEAVKDIHEALAAAKEIGYPVMLKASAGGGGVGLQVIQHEEELAGAFEANTKRAASLFGNDSMFIEKLIEHARHVEVQVLADTKGNAVHLYDRECSIQRRNQKVIEEAPCTFISDTTRREMEAASLRAVKAIDYVNAGTIEFLVDEQECFYFLEMNTRIQVEHPVTEAITGVDIVKEQILIANGDALRWKQADIKKHGHAIEARIYAEDPKTLFPSPGKITHYKAPEGKNIRVESSVKEDMQVTPFYDPMISKLIVSSTSRKEAIALLQEALDQYKIKGIKTNIPLIIDIIRQQAFQSGNVTTNYVTTFMNNEGGNNNERSESKYGR